MMMFVQLLVFTCACALGAADEVPPYGNIYNTILEARKILKKNILSMDGNVPLVDDPRRHYAEIIHVVHDEAQNELSCLGHDYYEDYQTNINLSAPFAIANPQSVVDGTKRMLKDVITNMDKMLQLVNVFVQNRNPDSDKAIDEEINKNLEEYGWPKKVFLATGIVATQLNLNHEDSFDSASNNLEAHNFVITNAPLLEKIVMALKNLYQLLYRPHGLTC